MNSLNKYELIKKEIENGEYSPTSSLQKVENHGSQSTQSQSSEPKQNQLNSKMEVKEIFDPARDIWAISRKHSHNHLVPVCL